MKIITKTLFSSLLLLASSSAFAEFGEKVNCRNESSQVAIYRGYASCNVAGNTISQYVFTTTSPVASIADWVNGRYYSCLASVPFAGYETVVSEQCDYKPVARAAAFPSGTATTIVSATGRDFDGNIVANKLWINGALQSSTVVEGFWNEGTVLNVRAQTTDNDGYTHEATTRYVVQYTCDDGPINIC